MKRVSFDRSRLVSMGKTAFLICLLLSRSPNEFAKDVRAQEVKNQGARITAIEPASLVCGSPVTWKVRGFDLKQATRLRFPTIDNLEISLKDARDAEPAKGLDNQQTGNTQVTAEFTVPANLPEGTFDFVIVTPTSEATGKVPVLSADSALDEQEPNNGFREAQAMSLGQQVRGTIQSDKDVDVFAIAVQADQQLKVTLTSGGPLLMDSEITCYDEQGQFLAAADDDPQTRDPNFVFTTKTNGNVLLCVSNAHDLGGPWQSYLLRVEEVKK